MPDLHFLDSHVLHPRIEYAPIELLEARAVLRHCARLGLQLFGQGLQKQEVLHKLFEYIICMALQGEEYRPWTEIFSVTTFRVVACDVRHDITFPVEVVERAHTVHEYHTLVTRVDERVIKRKRHCEDPVIAHVMIQYMSCLESAAQIVHVRNQLAL
jgi:hypothetical protein